MRSRPARHREAERLWLGLRPREGVGLEVAGNSAGAKAWEGLLQRLAELSEERLLEQHKGRLRLTARAVAVSDEILARLV